ncbi:MAG: T9SS type A sorting domain-containing protein, partial [Candidatus Marinimicrobia bacterium]|nr:T9SS type A sorting domain-containing protein [Candidatus Neomarinimicrobiota bacterium]
GAVSSTSKGTISALAASTEYSGSASSLSASTSYDVYVVAQDDEGSPNIQASPTKIDVTTTVAASSPTASTSAASSIDHESATLNGSVTANNASTTVTFEYGLTDSYGSNATAAESPVTGSSGTSVSTDVSSLSASTTYHFRVKAVNSEGTVYGSDATLTTSAAPVSPTSGVVYISEISDAASSSNEFMELYNNSSSTIDLSSTKIIRLSSAGAYDSYTFDFGTDGSGSTVIPANGLLIVSRGNDQSSFESAWGSLPEGVNFYTGTSTLYFGTGRQWQIKDSGTANTNDGTLIDETGEAVASSSNRSYQTPVGTWTTESYSGNATPGELEGTQETSLPVVLSSWKATSSNGIVKLFWITDSEIENQGFIIERIQKTEDRSQNAWKEISSFTTNPDLLGQGSTSSQNEYSYIDMQVKVGKTYNYLLADVDYRGNITRHDEINVTVKDAGTDLKPSDVSLHAAFPNPFNPDVNLSFTLDNEASLLALEVYDIQGALVNTLSSGYHATGIHDFNWDGNDTQGNAVSSGVYMVRLSANSVVHIQRVTLLR